MLKYTGEWKDEKDVERFVAKIKELELRNSVSDDILTYAASQVFNEREELKIHFLHLLFHRCRSDTIQRFWRIYNRLVRDHYYYDC